MRDDIGACVNRWDSKTQKRFKKWDRSGESLEDLAQFIQGELALAVEPAAIWDPDRGESGGPSIWGILTLTERQLLFHSGRGQVRIPLAGVDHLHIHPPAGLVGFLSAGELIQLQAGTNETIFELQSNGATQRLWPALEMQVVHAKEAVQTQSSAHSAADSGHAMSLADEIRKLDQLRVDGILSDAEFEAQKQRLLAN